MKVYVVLVDDLVNGVFKEEEKAKRAVEEARGEDEWARIRVTQVEME